MSIAPKRIHERNCMCDKCLHEFGKANMNDQIKTAIEALRDIRIPIHAYSCDHNMAEVLKKVDATIAALTASADSAQDERDDAPEAWLSKFDELLEDYVGACVETAVFNTTQRSGMKVRMARPRFKALMAHVQTVRASLASNLQAGEPVAYTVVSELGGIHKMAIKRESAEHKAAAWAEEWPNNKCCVRPLIFGDAAPQAQQEAGKDAQEKAGYALRKPDGTTVLLRLDEQSAAGACHAYPMTYGNCTVEPVFYRRAAIQASPAQAEAQQSNEGKTT